MSPNQRFLLAVRGEGVKQSIREETQSGRMGHTTNTGGSVAVVEMKLTAHGWNVLPVVGVVTWTRHNILLMDFTPGEGHWTTVSSKLKEGGGEHWYQLCNIISGSVWRSLVVHHKHDIDKLFILIYLHDENVSNKSKIYSLDDIQCAHKYWEYTNLALKYIIA